MVIAWPLVRYRFDPADAWRAVIHQQIRSAGITVERLADTRSHAPMTEVNKSAGLSLKDAFYVFQHWAGAFARANCPTIRVQSPVNCRTVKKR
jgi:hypothetical protein